MDNTSIGQKIKELRIKQNMTQKELAAKSGLSEITIRKYESNERKPKIENIRNIAIALGGKLSDFLTVGQMIEEYDPIDGIIDTVVKKEDGTVERTSRSFFTYNSNAHTNEELPLTERERQLIEYFRLLNDKGKDKALEDVEMYTMIAMYRDKGVINKDLD